MSIDRIKTRFEEHKNDDKGSSVAMGWWIDDVGKLLARIEELTDEVNEYKHDCVWQERDTLAGKLEVIRAALEAADALNFNTPLIVQSAIRKSAVGKGEL